MADTKELIVIIRPSFMKFCKDGCRSAAFNHILYWIAQKAKDQPQEKIQNGDVSWYATTEEVTEGLANAWGVCKVRQEVNALIDMGIIGRDKNRQWGADRTKHFVFGKEQCANLLKLCQEHGVCLHTIGLSVDVLQMIDLSNATDEIIICKCGKHQMQIIDLSNGHAQANDESIEAITKVKDTTKVSNKGEDQVPPHLQSFHLLYSNSRFARGSKKIDTKRIEQYEALAPEITTLEQLENLYTFTEGKIYGQNKTVFLGNIVNELQAWKLEKERESKQSTVTQDDKDYWYLGMDIPYNVEKRVVALCRKKWEGGIDHKHLSDAFKQIELPCKAFEVLLNEVLDSATSPADLIQRMKRRVTVGVV